MSEEHTKADLIAEVQRKLGELLASAALSEEEKISIMKQAKALIRIE